MRVFAERSVRRRALAFGLGHRHEELRRLERGWWRARVRETFAQLGQSPDFDAYFDALFAYFADPAHWIADVEAAPVLQRLKSNGLKLGVISNFDFRLYRILDGLDLTRYFDLITISSEAGYAKPRREVYDAALARAGVNARDAMHVGDSEHLDFAPAAALGIAAVLVDRENGPRRRRLRAARREFARLPASLKLREYWNSLDVIAALSLVKATISGNSIWGLYR